MEKIIYIILLILLNDKFYKNIKTIYNPKSFTYIVNKNIKLEEKYIPKDLEIINIKYACKDKYLRKNARIAFESMAKEAKKSGLNIIAVSAFRSYEYQSNLYNNYVLKKGINYANFCCAKAGHSEHQTGLSVDIADSSLDYDNFFNTKEFLWMKNNAYKYGFILRYPKAKFDITGFKYEPWHYRYVGVTLATYLYKNDLTLEEYKKSSL